MPASTLLVTLASSRVNHKSFQILNDYAKIEQNHLVRSYMFLGKKHKHNFFKPQFLLASFFTSILSVLLFCTTTTVFAASAPPYLTLSISTPTVNFHFNQAENAASAFKEDMSIVQYDTDNSTGFTAYVSSIDEDTNLKSCRFIRHSKNYINHRSRWCRHI